MRWWPRRRAARWGLASALGVAGVFNADVTADSVVASWEALVGKRAFMTNPPATGNALISETFWGVGLRIRLSYRASQVGTNLSVAMLAAKAEVKAADVSYQIHSLGLGPTQMAEILRGIPLLGGFNMTTYSLLEDLRDALTKALLKQLDTTDATRQLLRPAVVTLSASPFPKVLDEAAAYRLCMQCLAAKLTLAQSLAFRAKEGWNSVTDAMLTQVYREECGSDGPPSAVASKRASDWLFVP